MTEAVAGLTLKAIDTLTVTIKRTSGLITQKYHCKQGVCVLGSLGLSESGKYRSDRQHRILRSLDITTLGTTAFEITAENDRFRGTPLQRKRYMLKWLREQRQTLTG